MCMTIDKHKRFPHGDLMQLASNLWYVEGSIKMPLGAIKRNMVVYKLPTGELILHSVVAMNEAGMTALEGLGRPAYMIVPHGGHRTDARFYKQRYPDIKVLAPTNARAKVEEVIPVDATAEAALPPLGIELHKVEGLKTSLSENALVVDIDGGRALIMNDVIGGDGFGGAQSGLMIRMLGTPGGKIGISRAVRWVAIADRMAVKATLDKLAQIPNLKLLTISHGAPVRERVAEGIRAAAAQL
jgi:hypothetical protein